MIKRLLPGLFLVILLLPAVLVACSSTGKEPDTVLRTNIPPIDASAPAKIETATFSLG